MAHRLYNAAATMAVTGDAMTAGRDQAVRMLQGAAALRVANANRVVARAALVSARKARAEAEARRDQAMARLAATKARLARS